MEEKIIYSSKLRNPSQNNIMRINETIGVVLRKLGGRVVNSSYVLLERVPVEAYGYYIFPGVSIIRTSLKLKNSEYVLYVNFTGFDGDAERYNKLKMYLEDTLNKVLH